MKENPAITGIMMGEGERTLTELCEYFEQCEQDAHSLSQNRDEARNETAGAGMEYEKKSGAFTELNEEMLKKNRWYFLSQIRWNSGNSAAAQSASDG